MNLDVGTFRSIPKTKLRLDSTDATFGTQLSFEDNLGLDSRITDSRLDGLWRYGKRSSVDFSYFDLHRDAVAPVTFTIRWGRLRVVFVYGIQSGLAFNSFLTGLSVS